jgi:hypothetical protein
LFHHNPLSTSYRFCSVSNQLALFSLFTFQFTIARNVYSVFSILQQQQEALAPKSSPRFKIKRAGTQIKQHHKGNTCGHVLAM